VGDQTLLLNLQGTWFRVQIAALPTTVTSGRTEARFDVVLGSLHGSSSRCRRRPSPPPLWIRDAVFGLKASELQARTQGLRPKAVTHGREPEPRIRTRRSFCLILGVCRLQTAAGRRATLVSIHRAQAKEGELAGVGVGDRIGTGHSGSGQATPRAPGSVVSCTRPAGVEPSRDCGHRTAAFVSSGACG